MSNLTALLRSLPDDPFDGPDAPTVHESPEWSAAMKVRDERDAIFATIRTELRVDPDTCPGCYLGDDGPAMHDLGYGCEYGKGAG